MFTSFQNQLLDASVVIDLKLLDRAVDSAIFQAILQREKFSPRFVLKFDRVVCVHIELVLSNTDCCRLYWDHTGKVYLATATQTKSKFGSYGEATNYPYGLHTKSCICIA